jgi:uncharacterized protein YkwD/uncharacterized membrane protein required for colicin V production
MVSIYDLIIIGFVILFTVGGYFKGLIRQLGDLVILITSFMVGLLFYNQVSATFLVRFSFVSGIAKPIAFMALWVITEFALKIMFYFVYKQVPEEVRKSKINRGLGAIPGVVWGILFVSIIISILAALPIKGGFKEGIVGSSSGSFIISKVMSLEGIAGKIFGGSLSDTLEFVTVDQNGQKSVDLGFKINYPTIDAKSEEEMFSLLNKERAKVGEAPLKMDEKLRTLAREYGTKILADGYFSHVSKDGKDPFDRMKESHIGYIIAGENLAFAVNVQAAHNGLMNSSGHRANILTSEYGKVGIGCLDAGPKGKIFVQEFTD